MSLSLVSLGVLYVHVGDTHDRSLTNQVACQFLTLTSQ